jgi:D-alanyl-D-alanine carboxypeptidase
MSIYSDEHPTPAQSAVNSGLTVPNSSYMLTKFGKPGVLSDDCSDITNKEFNRHIIYGAQVHQNFKVSGFEYAVHSLERIFSRVRSEDPDLYAAIKTAGMLCCRHIRGNPAAYSNHAWGCAIDLKFGTDIDTVGDGMTQQGLLLLYPYFHPEKWFWGAGYKNRAREDSMHFELSREILDTIKYP